MFEGFDTSVSGMVAHRIWLDTIQGNVANINTTRDEQGIPNPYKRRFPIFSVSEKGPSAGVEVANIDQNEGYKLELDPDHPDAIKSGKWAGHVRMPKVNINEEMVNAIVASRAYEANVTALNVSKQMYMSSLRILG